MNASLDTLTPQLSEMIDFNALTAEQYILSNTADNHYVKINQQTYNILHLIDGKKNLKTICNEYQQQFSQYISINVLHQLLYEKLAQYGILKNYNEIIKPYKKPFYLKLSFMIIKPKVLSYIVRWFYFLFYKYVATFVLLLSLSSIFVLLMPHLELYQTFNLRSSVIYYFLFSGVSTVFHEIGHATSASFFKAKHGGIGIGFYLLSPVFYADVTDIWRLPKKQRIIVSLSGVYFEIIFCSLLASLGFLTDNYTLMIISLLICIQALFNLNPFLRSDGYWVLSDLLNKPNLQYHSSQKIKELYQSLFRGKKSKWGKMGYILLTYSLLNYGILIIFLYYILIQNPNLIILFPKNLYEFILSVFDSTSNISLIEYGKLIVPIIFFILVFNLVKVFHKTRIKKKYA